MAFPTVVVLIECLFNYFSTCIAYSIRIFYPAPKPRIALTNPKDPRSAYKRVDNRFTAHYAFQATTIPELAALTFEKNDPERPTLGYRKVLSKFAKENGEVNLELSDYFWLSMAQVRETIDKLVLGFVFHGVTFQQRVLIYAETSPEWFLCAQALWRIGATVATLFANLGTEGIIHGITETGVEQIITTRDLLPGLLDIIQQLPKVQLIYVLELHRKVLPIQMDQSDFTKVSPVKLIFYETLLKNGKQVSIEQIESQSPSADDIAVVMYTSGSTGLPKGVLLSHRNIVTACQAVYSSFDARIMNKSREQTYYAFLPLAHVFELASEVGSFGAGWAIGYGHVSTIVDHSPGLSPGTAGDLTLLRPTIMSAVPLLLERMRMKLSTRIGKSVTKQTLARIIIKYKNFWRYFGMDTPVINQLICQKAQASLGGRVKTMLVAGAHLNIETQEIIQNLFNIRILVGFGATETCAGSFISDYDDTLLGTTTLLHGNQFRLIDWQEGGYFADNLPNPRGELLLAGPSVALGYLEKPQMTAEAFEVDSHGTRWFKTGDIVEVLPGSRIQIIDRKKDLVKMANGEFVSLGKAETALRCFPLLEHVALFSSVRHNYLVALFAVNEAALRELAAQMLTDEQMKGISLKGLCQNVSLQLVVHKELRTFCKENSLPARVIPRHFKLCPEKWTVASGLLTGSLKINRGKITTFYRDTIQELFEL